MKRNTKVLGLGLGLLAVGAGIYSLTPSATPKAPQSSTTGASAPSPSAELLMFRFAPDTTYEYELGYASKTKLVPMAGSPSGLGSATAMGQRIDGDLDLEGTLELHAYGDSTLDGEEATLVGFALKGCKGHFTVANQPAWGAEGCNPAFDGRELLVRIDRFGRVKSIHAPAGGASLFDYTMRGLVEEMQVRIVDVAGVKAWVETESLPQGKAESLYRMGDTDGLNATIERSRPHYISLAATSLLNAGDGVKQSEVASARIEIARGVVANIHGKETLSAKLGDQPVLDSTTTLDVTWKGSRVDERGRPDLSAFSKRALEDLPESTSLHTRMLEQRAAGLSWSFVLDTLNTYGEAGHVPDHNRFLWRATALLELDPKRAFDFVPLFDGAKPGGKRRGLLMDMLASVPTAEAQQVLRQLLASEQAKSDPRYVQLMQRIGFVEEPNKETIAFMRAKNKEATAANNKNQRLASAYTLGSMAGNTKDESEKRVLVEDLTLMLRDAPANEKAYYLNALANTDSAEAIPTFAKHATSESAEVRAAVADALDEPQLPESLALLLRLAADPDKDVQHAALKSLRVYKLDAAVIFKLAAISNDGKLHPENVATLLDLVKTYRFVAPKEMEALLTAVLAHPIDEALVRGAAQALLDAR